eukprot:TRINITY_DN11434_c0_g1_i8.p2 TRINITY_DN11434_c0_g1~~TRINITY_DN11434_c0_g1_i8.p2  ORF type:complete len:263 (+),score=76.53 TRINITY_DN11434_c0_g1_i8:59-790(+)
MADAFAAVIGGQGALAAAQASASAFAQATATAVATVSVCTEVQGVGQASGEATAFAEAVATAVASAFASAVAEVFVVCSDGVLASALSVAEAEAFAISVETAVAEASAAAISQVTDGGYAAACADAEAVAEATATAYAEACASALAFVDASCGLVVADAGAGAVAEGDQTGAYTFTQTDVLIETCPRPTCIGSVRGCCDQTFGIGDICDAGIGGARFDGACALGKVFTSLTSRGDDRNSCLCQ